jgi:MinD-like ATPase involved in chromosome partitioning or flagellar assembly
VATGIVTAGGGHAWETGVVAQMSGPGAPLVVVRRCADVADGLAVASTGQISAALVAADLRRLDSETVSELAAFGVLVVAVARAGDTRTPDLLERIGVATVVFDDAAPPAIVQAVSTALTGDDAGSPRDEQFRTEHRGNRAVVGSDPARALGAAPPRATSQGSPGPRFVPSTPVDAGTRGVSAASPPDALAAPREQRTTRRARKQREGRPAHAARGSRRASQAVEAEPPAADLAADPGRVIAVWGPAGAPGRSTVAMGLADRVVARGSSVVLIDADVYGGVLANAFGLLDESAGLAGACRLASNGRLGAAEFAELCWQVRERFTLMTGIARADRWPELRPSSIPLVLDAAREFAEVVIVDCSSVVETDEEITFDTLAPRRNGATLAVLTAADVVIAVGAADPAGMERLARGYADVTAAVANLEPAIVFNRVRPTAASQSELRDASRRFCGSEPVAFLPEDRALVDLAWRQGVTLSMAASKSPLISAFDHLAQAVVSVPASR